MNHNREDKSLTFRRGSEVSQVTALNPGAPFVPALKQHLQHLCGHTRLPGRSSAGSFKVFQGSMKFYRFFVVLPSSKGGFTGC